MKRTSRKLQFRVETVRNLTASDLNKVGGGASSQRETMCSTMDRLTHCACPGFSDNCSWNAETYRC